VAREVSARDFEEDLGDEGFEQLVSSIAFAQHPDAERTATAAAAVVFSANYPITTGFDARLVASDTGCDATASPA
jgi:hypothetical protein